MKGTEKPLGYGGLVLLTLASIFLAASGAERFWNEKDFEDWTEKECRELLSQSPWSQPFALTGLFSPEPLSRAGNLPSRSGAESLGDREVHLVIQLRFLTARPVQLAVGRLRMLATPDDTSIQQGLDQWLRQPDPEQIVVEATYYSRPAGHPELRGIEAFFRTATLEQLQNRCYLSHSESGTTVSLSGYQPPGERIPRALLLFPRYDDQGQPYFDGEEKTVLFRLQTDFGSVEEQFHPVRMRFNGKFTM